MKIWTTVITTPLGGLIAYASDAGLRALLWPATEGTRFATYPDAIEQTALPLFRRLERQLGEYFAGTRRRFELDLDPQGTAFQRQAWDALCAIPYGATRTYREQAVAIGRPAAVRAIGAANGRNALSIVVPCHRVIGADGSLTGFAGGLAAKRYLLDLESGC